MTEQLNHFIAERLYDATMTTGAWPGIMNDLAQMLGAHGTVIVLANDPAQAIEVANHSRFLTTADLSEFRECYADMESVAHTRLASAPPRTIAFDTEFWPTETDYLANPLNRWLRSKGTFRRIGATLNTHRAWYDLLGVHFAEHSWPPTDAQVNAMTLLLPHLSRIMELNRAFSILQAQFGMIVGALDRFEIGIGIVDTNGRLIIANAELRELLLERDGLAVDRQDRLIGASDRDTRALQAAIAGCQATLLKGNGTAEAKLSLTRRSGSVDLLVDISPIRDRSNASGERIVGSLVLIVDPDQRHAIRADCLEQIYALTDAERKVCDLLLDGRSNTDIADIRNVSIETVKTQVKALFQKTHTGNRYDLTRLAVTVNPPIRRNGAAVPGLSP